MSNSIIFDTHVRIDPVSPLSRDAVWPSNIEVCVTRFPIRRRDGYSPELVKGFVSKLKSSMVKNGIVYIVCYAPSECKYRPFEIAKEMSDAGFHHVDNIVAEKTWMPGRRAENMLVNSHDYIMMFVNGDVWKFDRAPIRYYMMQEEGAPCIGNVWVVQTGGLDEAYSDDMAELLLRFSDLLPGSCIFDPFMGNGGILKACLKLGHSLVGFETDPRKMMQYQKVLEEYSKKMKGEG